MSGAQNPLLQGAAQLPAQQNVPQQPVQQQPSGPLTADQHGHLVSGTMRGKGQQAMVSRRDAAGPELEMLSRVMNDPDPKPNEVTEYMSSLVKSGQLPAQEANQIIRSMPKDPDALRTWARSMFSVVMHAGVHGHAAFPAAIFPGTPQENGDASGNQEPASS